MRLYAAMQAFNRVAELKSFAAAARDLGVSTSSVSRHVMDLEDELGVRLLNRTTRRLNLTEEGAVYRERSAAILEELEELHGITRDQHGNPRGRLRITSSFTLGESWLVPLLPAFYRAYPDIVIELDLTDRVVDLVEDGFDVGVRSGDLRDSSMIARRLMDLHYIACAAPQYCAENGMPLRPDDLQHHKCIQYLHPSHQHDDWWFDIDGKETWVDIEGIIAINNAWGARDLVVAGVGLGYLPDFVVQNDLNEDRLVRVMPDFDSSADPVHVVYPHKRHLSAKVRVFVDHLVANADTPPEVGL